MSVFKKDEKILFTSGECSDYGVDCLVLVLKDFSQDDTGLEWAKATKRKIEFGSVVWGMSDQIGYLPWLEKNGYVKEIPFREVNEYDWNQLNIGNG